MDAAWYIAAALMLDLIVGDPRWLPHPVRGIGRLAGWAAPVVRRRIVYLRIAGVVLTFGVVGVTVLVAWGALQVAALTHPAVHDILAVLLIYFSMAPRDLMGHSRRVFRALAAEDLVEARRKVGWMVGRDTDQLEESAVTRAAVESVAEGTVDGVTAPLFYAVVAGPIGAFAYRSINTLDSMFGYASYGRFGWCAARLDDVANFLPARLTVPFIWLAALLLGERAGAAVRLTVRDCRNHASPNAGFGEAAYAGALGIRLGGDDRHHGKARHRPTLGDDRETISRGHILRANRILLATTVLVVAVGVGVKLI